MQKESGGFTIGDHTLWAQVPRIELSLICIISYSMLNPPI